MNKSLTETSASDSMDDDNKLYWESGFSCWLSFVHEYGVEEPIHNDKPALNRWVQQQREAYACFLEGKQTDLDQEKIAKMEANHFRWTDNNKNAHPSNISDVEQPAGELTIGNDDQRGSTAAKKSRNTRASIRKKELKKDKQRQGDVVDDASADSNESQHDEQMLNTNQENDVESEATQNTQEETDESISGKKAPSKSPPASGTTALTDGASGSGRYPRRARRSLSEMGGSVAHEEVSAAKRVKTSNDPKRKAYSVLKIGKNGKKEVRKYETRNLSRLIPVEEEEELREQCRSEFAELLKSDEPIEADKAKGVDPHTAKCNRSWEEQFFEFLVFVKVYGHGIVPKLCAENPALGRWTTMNRRWRRKQSKSLTRSRKRRLDQAGFVWEAKKDPTFWVVQQQTLQEKDKWEHRFQMLVAYKESHGNVLVPKEYPENMVLSRWVGDQRKQYRAKLEGRQHNLSDEREQRLLDLGFIFNTRTREYLRNTVLSRGEDRWMACFSRLLEFKQRFGHAAVPRRWKEDADLASWAMRQRSHGKKFMRGEKNYLTQERFDRLKAVDFVFDMDRNKYPVDEGKSPPQPKGSSECANVKPVATTEVVEGRPVQTQVVESVCPAMLTSASLGNDVTLAEALADPMTHNIVALNASELSVTAERSVATSASASIQEPKRDSAGGREDSKSADIVTLEGIEQGAGVETTANTSSARTTKGCKSTEGDGFVEDLHETRKRATRTIETEGTLRKDIRESQQSVAFETLEEVTNKESQPRRTPTNIEQQRLPIRGAKGSPETLSTNRRRSTRSSLQAGALSLQTLVTADPETSRDRRTRQRKTRQKASSKNQGKKSTKTKHSSGEMEKKEAPDDIKMKSTSDEPVRPEMDPEGQAKKEQLAKDSTQQANDNGKQAAEHQAQDVDTEGLVLDSDKGPTLEEQTRLAAEQLMELNRGRWACENCGKDAHWSYIHALVHEAECASLQSIAINDSFVLD